MLKHNGGSIVNLASVASKVALPDRFAYGMTKGAVLAMTLSAARDFVGEGIRCNCVCPARVHTPFVEGFLAKNYSGKEAEMFARRSAAQPIGRMVIHRMDLSRIEKKVPTKLRFFVSAKIKQNDP